MSKTSAIYWRPPPALKAAVEGMAKQDGMSVNTFLTRMAEGELQARRAYILEMVKRNEEALRRFSCKYSNLSIVEKRQVGYGKV